MLFVFTLFIILYGYLKERSSKTLITWNNYKNVTPRARKSLIQIMNSLCLKDPFQIFNNDLRRYTWHRNNPIRHARLDFFLINQNLIDFIDKCKIKPGSGSDQSNIELLVTFYKFERDEVYGNLTVHY